MKQDFNYNIFKSKGFKLVNNSDSIYFGDHYYIYYNNIINIRLVSDKSKISVGVKSKFERDNWFDLILIKSLIDSENNLLGIMTIKEYNSFLENYLDVICELFNKQNYSSTKQKLEFLESERVRIMFPNINKKRN